ncbi:hypothetical protein M409DRAFT_16664 [Zasmidium cellare ATCC 36951]|uniref:NAD(P)-binding protein n=1 Tax=Zasmidium cellare ATCC 36951 TaxID=1080233 RepID=A0A6A6D102_ZASCE|nr:uncharacterized protein M409DRAFT_16664 [Zasmidium cellare ATCC 36951]KAF2172703.1 hypothetical protein M409DRAFT_16664 [Zasmidium cellare ATCC 36951]
MSTKSPVPRYSWNGPVDHTIPVDKSKIKGKSVIITGGANGMGEVAARRFIIDGAFVTVGDMDVKRGEALEAELKGRLKFVKCNIKSWEDQVALFDAATGEGRGVDVVIANAGISRSSDPSGPPTKPDLNIVETNVNGTFYTFKLATHYFRKQPMDRDRSFMMTGSLTAWIDSPGNWEYTASKYALRGLMRTVRCSSWEQGIRINFIGPNYIKSAIRTPEYEKYLMDLGVRFGEAEDVASCMERLAADQSINGHSLMIVPRAVAKEGYMDVQDDDHVDGKREYFAGEQAIQLNIIKDQWLDGVPTQIYKR